MIPAIAAIIGVVQSLQGAKKGSPVERLGGAVRQKANEEKARVDANIASGISRSIGADGRVKLELPDYLADDQDFVANIQPLLDQKLQYKVDGTPVHGLLDDATFAKVKNLGDSYTGIYSSAQNLANEGAAKDRAEGVKIIKAVSGANKDDNFKLNAPGVNDPIAAKDLFKGFEDMSASQLRSYKQGLDKIASGDYGEATTQAKIIQALAGMDRYKQQMDASTGWENFNAGLTGAISGLADGGVGGFVGNVIDKISVGGDSIADAKKEAKQIEEYGAQGEQRAAKIGGVAGAIGNVIADTAATMAITSPIASTLKGTRLVSNLATKYPRIMGVAGAIGREGAQAGLYSGIQRASGEQSDLGDFFQDAILGAGLSAVPTVWKGAKTLAKEGALKSLQEGSVGLRGAAGLANQGIDELADISSGPAIALREFKDASGATQKLRFAEANIGDPKNIAKATEAAVNKNTGFKALGDFFNTKSGTELAKVDGKNTVEFIDAVQRGDDVAAEAVLQRAGVKNLKVDDVRSALDDVFEADLKAGAILGRDATEFTKNYFPTGPLKSVGSDFAQSFKKGDFKKIITSDRGKAYQFLIDRIKDTPEGLTNTNLYDILASRTGDTVARVADARLAKELTTNGAVVKQLSGEAADIANRDFGGYVERSKTIKGSKDAFGKPIRQKEIAATPEFLRANGYELMGQDSALTRAMANVDSATYMKNPLWVKSDVRRFLTQYESYAPTRAGRVLAGTANASSLLQNIRLSGGVPNSTLNYFSIMESVSSALASGNPKGAARVMRNFVQANSDASTAKRIAEETNTVENALKAGWQGDPSGLGRKYIGKIKGVDKNVRFSDISDGVDNKIASQLVEEANLPAGARAKAKEAISSGIGKFDEVMGGKTMTNLMTLNQLDALNAVYKKGIKKGLSETEAWEGAANSVNKFYNGGGRLSRKLKTREAQETFDNILTTMFVAPRYRSTMIGRIVDTLKLADARQWADPKWLADNALQINYLKMASTLFIAGSLFNKAVNKKWPWENPTGASDEIQIPVGDKKLGFSMLGSFGVLPRLAGRTVSEFASGDTEGAFNQATWFLSVGLQPLVRGLSGEDYFGNPIEGGLSGRAGYIAGQLAGHPFVTGLSNYIQGKDMNALFGTLELPLRVRDEQIGAKISFNKEVMPAIDSLNEDYDKKFRDVYNQTDDPIKQQELYDNLTKDYINEAKNIVSAWTDDYGRNVLELTPSERSRVLAGLSNERDGGRFSSNDYRYAEKMDLASSEKADLTAIARETGIPLDTIATISNEIRNTVYGAPRQLRYEFEQAVKDKSSGQSLRDTKKSYEALLDAAYERKDYKEVERLTREYNTRFDVAIAPLIDKYGVEALANNYTIVKDLSDYIKIPYSDLKKAGRVVKNPLLRADTVQFLKERYGVGDRVTTSLPSDQEVADGIIKANESLRNGDTNSAKYQASNLLKSIEQGRLYGTEPDYRKLTEILTN